MKTIHVAPPSGSIIITFEDGSTQVHHGVVSVEDVATETPVWTFVDCAKHLANVQEIAAEIARTHAVRLRVWTGAEVIGVAYCKPGENYRDDIVLSDGESLIDRYFLSRWFAEKYYPSLVARAVYGYWVTQ